MFPCTQFIADMEPHFVAPQFLLSEFPGAYIWKVVKMKIKTRFWKEKDKKSERSRRSKLKDADKEARIPFPYSALFAAVSCFSFENSKCKKDVD